jgi:hypothetical protein
MMPETVREMAAGNKVAVTRLFEFEFASKTGRYWDGFNTLSAGGFDWQGSAGIIGVSGLEWAEGLSASQATFTLSGTTPELVEAAINSEEEVTDRPCAVFIQFLSARYVPLDQPVAIWTGIMDRLVFKGDVKNQQLSLQAETLFVDRVRSPNGLLTDPDHQARWPGDLGMQFAPKLIHATVDWLRS